MTMEKQGKQVDSLQNKFWRPRRRKINNFKYLRTIKRIMVCRDHWIISKNDTIYI